MNDDRHDVISGPWPFPFRGVTSSASSWQLVEPVWCSLPWAPARSPLASYWSPEVHTSSADEPERQPLTRSRGTS